MHAVVQWLAKLNIKRNVTSMFENKKHRYMSVRLRLKLHTMIIIDSPT